MGYLVVVHVPTEDGAQHIVDRYSQGDAGRVVGMYELASPREPTCPGGCGRGQHGWGRHEKGHWVCGSCGNRNRDWRKRIAVVLMDTFGMNLLPRERTPSLFRNPQGWDPR